MARRIRASAGRPEAVSRDSWDRSVSRVRTRDRGVAYWVRSRGGSRWSRSTTRAPGGVGATTTASATPAATRATA